MLLRRGHTRLQTISMIFRGGLATLVARKHKKAPDDAGALELLI
jgi:hypothetical protein